MRIKGWILSQQPKPRAAPIATTTAAEILAPKTTTFLTVAEMLISDESESHDVPFIVIIEPLLPYSHCAFQSGKAENVNKLYYVPFHVNKYQMQKLYFGQSQM